MHGYDQVSLDTENGTTSCLPAGRPTADWKMHLHFREVKIRKSVLRIDSVLRIRNDEIQLVGASKVKIKREKYQHKCADNYAPLFHSVSICPRIGMRWEMRIYQIPSWCHFPLISQGEDIFATESGSRV